MFDVGRGDDRDRGFDAEGAAAEDGNRADVHLKKFDYI